jgi:cellobiose epimerase
MKKNIGVILVLLTVLISCAENKNISKKSSFKYSPQVENLIGFFDKYAYDSIQKTYYSEIDNEGNVVSKKIYNVALSRMIYGLAYTSKFYPENIEKAKNAVEFQLNNLIATDSVGMYFVSNSDSGIKSESNQIDIWQQAYGLCGLTEYYRNSPNDELLKKIQQLNDAFVKRFKDTINGGFYGNYSFEKGQVSGSKSIQSLMYPVTSYMANLWDADTSNKNKYENILKENLEILYKIGWNKETGWVNVKFNDSWEVCTTENNKGPCFTVTPGHNFQLASLFLRTKDWPFLSEGSKIKYQVLGNEILSKTLANPNLNNIGNGFYSEFNSITNTVLDKRKTWWQHAEAIIALSFASEKYSKELNELEKFYFKNFQDTINGGEYFYVTENDEPITKELKGSIGKSIYHTIEMIRFSNTSRSKSNEKK